MQDMNNIEAQLDEVLAKHIAYNKQLLEVIKHERHCIIHSDIVPLDEINRKKVTLKQKIAEAEEERLNLIGLFEEKYTIEKKPVTLSDIIEIVPKEWKISLKKRQSSLRALLGTIQVAHKGNRMLMERSLNFQERSFMMLFGLAQENVGYDTKGKMNHSHKSLIDSKV